MIPGAARCPETVLHNGARFQCRKASGHEGNHWAIRNDGLDVVWAVHVLLPPAKKEA